MRTFSNVAILIFFAAILSPLGAQNTGGEDDGRAQPAAAATPVPAPPAAPVSPGGVGPTIISAGGSLSSGESDYVLVVGDVVALNIFREPDLNTQATIARDGTVQLPLIREVKLAGLSIREARELLRANYDKQFLVDPQVFLNVVKYAERKFTIMGQVARPGSYELQGGERIDLLEAIGLAGGFTRIADRGRVIIQRKEGGEVKAIKANAKRMADGKAEPLEVQTGDVITVKESWF
ncbi:MAG: polysaccharide biosynthesis/export family protein [Chthoniobacterales bacterium]